MSVPPSSPEDRVLRAVTDHLDILTVSQPALGCHAVRTGGGSRSPQGASQGRRSRAFEIATVSSVTPSPTAP